MFHWPKYWLGLSIACFAQAAMAADWSVDVWHHVDAKSPFYSDERAGLHSAGVVQEDGRFALLVLGDSDQGAVMSVSLPDATPTERLISTLVMPSGAILTRTITQDQLSSDAMPELDARIVSFRIVPEDIDAFQAGRTWRIGIGESVIDVTLRGSRVAIEAARSAREARDNSLAQATD